MCKSSEYPAVENLTGEISQIIPKGIESIHVLVTKKCHSVQQSIIAEYIVGIKDPNRTLLNATVAFAVMRNTNVAFPENVSIYVVDDYTILVDSDQLNENQRDECTTQIANKIKVE